MESFKNIINRYILLSILLSFPYFCNAQDEETEPDTGCKMELPKKIKKIFEKGVEAKRKGLKSEAFNLFQEVTQKEPNYPDPYYLMGMMTLKEIEKENNNTITRPKDEKNIDLMLKQAENYFTKAIDVCPDFNPYCYFFLGKIKYSQGNYKQAISPMKTFLEQGDKVKSEFDFEEAENILKYSKFLDTILNNPVPFDLKRVQGISSPEDEYLFCLSPDNEICFYTRIVQPATSRTDLGSNKSREMFFYSTRDSLENFDSGNPMYDPFNQSNNEGSPTITADNRYLVFSRCEMRDGYYNCDLYYSENIKEEWSPIKSLGDNINSPLTWESQPSISADGQTLYFISDRKGGIGGYDIWTSRRNLDGSWAKAVNLGATINTPLNEKTPFIHCDNQTMYFSSEGLLSLGGMDIYYTKMDNNGRWSKPFNIGHPINTEGDDVGFFVSSDGKKGYYSSNNSGNFDLYEFNLYELARPNKTTIIKGKINKDDGDPITAKVELKNTMTKSVQQVPVDVYTGKYAVAAQAKNDYVLTVKKEGYAYESKLIKADSAIKKSTQKVDFEIKPIVVGESYKLNDINFPTNSFTLADESKTVIDGFVEFLNDNTSVKVEIQGHTDNIGNDAINMLLSENRAKSVYDYIVASGVANSRLSYKGYGKTKPVESNATEESRAKNRRTVFVILKR